MQKGFPGVGSFCYCASLSFAFTVTVAARIVYNLLCGSLHSVVSCCIIGVPLVNAMQRQVTGMKAKNRDALLNRLQLAMEKGIIICVHPLSGDCYSITAVLAGGDALTRKAHKDRLLVALDIIMEEAMETA